MMYAALSENTIVRAVMTLEYFSSIKMGFYLRDKLFSQRPLKHSNASVCRTCAARRDKHSLTSACFYFPSFSVD
jgi:hypothetical protein